MVKTGYREEEVVRVGQSHSTTIRQWEHTIISVQQEEMGTSKVVQAQGAELDYGITTGSTNKAQRNRAKYSM